MIVLGLLVLVLCLVAGAGIALANTDAISSEAFGVSLSSLSTGGLFLLGAAIGALAVLGVVAIFLGAARKRTKRAAHQREVESERESLAEENARLQAELERERDAGVYPSDDGDTHADRGAEVKGKHRR